MIIVEEGVRINVNNEHHTVVIPVAKNKTNIKVDEQLAARLPAAASAASSAPPRPENPADWRSRNTRPRSRPPALLVQYAPSGTQRGQGLEPTAP